MGLPSLCLLDAFSCMPLLSRMPPQRNLSHLPHLAGFMEDEGQECVILSKVRCMSALTPLHPSPWMMPTCTQPSLPEYACP